MKTSIFCAALTLMALFCSTGFCRTCRNCLPNRDKGTIPTRPPPTRPPSYYTTYLVERSSIKQLVDGTGAALFFLGQLTTSQGHLLPMINSERGEDIVFRDAVTAVTKIYELDSITSTTTDISANALISGLKTSVCQWLSAAMLPATNFTCTPENIQELSQVMDMYQTLRDTDRQVGALATGVDEYNFIINSCAWVNSHVLNGCTDIRSLDPRVMALDEIFRCSAQIDGYALCPDV